MAANPLRWRRLTLVAAVWTFTTLGAAVYGYWSVYHLAYCPEQTAMAAFCRYQALLSAGTAARGPLLAYGLGTIVLGLAWLYTMTDRPPCPECGSRGRSEMGVCRRCGYDPFDSPRSMP
jgi:hypothetical protein